MPEILNNQMPRELAEGSLDILATMLKTLDDLQDLSLGVMERLEVLQEKDERPKMKEHWKSVSWAFVTQTNKFREIQNKLAHVGLDLKE